MDLLSYAMSDEHKKTVNAEMNRIIGLEIKGEFTQELLEKTSNAFLLPNSEIDLLLQPQAEGLLTYIHLGGLFGAIGVGFGKSMLSVGIASLGFRKGLRRMVLLVPPNLVGKLMDHDLAWIRKQIPVNMPIHNLGGLTKKKRQNEYLSNRSGLYIVPYSLLSVSDTDEMLEAISPELIIADECHALKNKTSATTMRMMRYMNDNPSTEFVALSGTMTTKTIDEYAHIIKWCLKESTPLPRYPSELATWCEVLDTSFALLTPKKTLQPLYRFAKENFPDQMEATRNDISGFRSAYKLRLESTVGVVSSGDAEVKASLTIANLPVHDYKEHKDWKQLDGLIQQVNDEWLTPSEDEITEAFHLFKWNSELSAGFYNDLYWPSTDLIAERKQIAYSQAQDFLERSKEQHKMHNLFGNRLRKWIQEQNKRGLDTPLAVCNDMYYHGANNTGTEIYALWKLQRDLVFDDIIQRDKRAVRICSYKVDHAVQWAKSLKKGEGAIIWAYSKALQEWLVQACREAGLDPVACPAGTAGSASIQNPKNWKRIIVASITGHSTGKNLQEIQNHLIVQFPRPSNVCEQLLGRTHRTGVEKITDEVVYNTCITTPWEQQAQAATLVDACFSHETGTRQKLMYCNFLPQPKIFPSAILKARGLDSPESLYE